MARWLIFALPQGVYEVKSRGTRPQRCDDLESAKRYVKGRLGPGDKVVLEEEDGYRTTVTRSVLRCR